MAAATRIWFLVFYAFGVIVLFVQIFPDHTLVTAGPYHFVRHPIYSAVLALWLGAALGTLNWLLLALWPLMVGAVLGQARTEEEVLRAKFGEAYDGYAGRTGRLVPGFRRGG